MKIRCSRCHAKLDSHRKTCPYCGTMVRKRRGNVRVASSVDVGGMSSLIGNISLPALTGKHLLVIAAVIVAIIMAVAMLGCGSCGACSACASCQGCAACDSCGSCHGCGSCGSCSGEDQALSLNGANYNCEYHHGSTLYYVDGDKLMALEDGMETGQVVAGGKGIECIYADDSYVYYIISGQIFRVPSDSRVGVSASDVPLGTVLLAPETAGLEKINGFALAGESELCYWGQTADGGKVIGMTDRGKPEETRTIYTGKYSNVQCYRGGVFFVSGDELTEGQILRVDMESGSPRIMYAQKPNYYTLSDGCLVVNVTEPTAEGSPADESQLIYIDIQTAEELRRFESFPITRGIAANDRWIYYAAKEQDSDSTLIYRFSGAGEVHQLVFRKTGSYRLYGVADSYFSLFGEDVYYICNYDRMPSVITIKEHTVLDK